jgi:DNA-binding transcriptional regulator YhcF (GntR family)
MLGWVVVIFTVLLWVIIPIGQSIGSIETVEQVTLVLKEVLWGTGGEELVKLVVALLAGGSVVSVGSYMQRYGSRRKTEKEELALGYLKLTGRVSLQDLAAKIGLSEEGTVRMLSELRQKKDIVFNIDGNEVYIRGYERERPKEKETIKEVVKEIVKVACPHCGKLNEVTAKKCFNCSAPIRTP